MTGRRLLITGLLVLLSATAHARDVRRRALLIGINDYSASRWLTSARPAIPVRSWSNLDGAVNDVKLMHDLLIARYGFNEADIVVLMDQDASKAAIEREIRRHLFTAGKGDIAFFYYSGHGSQVLNSASGEDDKFDESLVPADSRAGAEDIRDKDLRKYFNTILDQGANLTAIFDACHSGSGARGLEDGAKRKDISPDQRDVKDASAGPEPEKRGALILSAARDFDLAFEIKASPKEVRGAFSWALARAMRDADRNESANDTFLRAQARLGAEMPSQTAVIAGNDRVKLTPLLRVGNGGGEAREVIAIQRREPDGSYSLRGGWANGITKGSILRVAGQDDLELEVTELDGAARAKARLKSAPTRGFNTLTSGTLLQIKSWVAPPSRDLRVWVPQTTAIAFASLNDLRKSIVRGGARWIDDPTETSPDHVIRLRNEHWERLTKGDIIATDDPLHDPFPRGAAIFVQLPAPSSLVQEIGPVEGIEFIDDIAGADYILAGRWTGERAEYAWVRPHVTMADRASSSMPLRSPWTASDRPAAALALRDDLLRLRRVHGWHDLPSPPADSQSHYTIGIRPPGNPQWITRGPLMGKQKYQLVLKLRAPPPDRPLHPRYFYAFVIDSQGKGVLLFPRPQHGSVENRLPLTRIASQPITNPPAEIPLGSPASFIVKEPYGLDAYFLLSTEEPLFSTASLTFAGFNERGHTNALDRLLSLSLYGIRGDDDPIRTPPNWSIEKLVLESVAPRRKLQ
jgi:caspase domain-containing protein